MAITRKTSLQLPALTCKRGPLAQRRTNTHTHTLLLPNTMPWAEVLEVDVNRINDDWDGKREEVIEFLEDMSVRNPEATVASTEKMT